VTQAQNPKFSVLDSFVRSFASGSVSEPGVFDAGFGWWEEFGFAVVGLDSDFPRRMVDDAVVVSAQQHEIVEVRLAAL
jgi:hypothetical protein